MLKVCLFGVGQASHNGQSLAGFPSQQHYRLLCYLLLNRRHAHTREQLAAVFWGEYSTATSRTYLRNTIWRLRSSLEQAGACPDEYLASESDSISFVNASHHWLDVDAFEAEAAACTNAPDAWLTPEQASHLQKAAELYTGDLLEGTYDDWCLCDRERLRLLYLSVLGKLLAFHEQAADYEVAAAIGEQILARDPAREKVHQCMMRLYWLRGDHDRALAQFRRCSQILRDEFGISPSAETQLLYEQMIHNRFEPAELCGLQEQPPNPATSGLHDALLARQLLKKVQHLQSIAEETSVELRSIAGLLGTTLAERKHM